MTQFLARLRYNDEALFEILGGRKAMIVGCSRKVYHSGRPPGTSARESILVGPNALHFMLRAFGPTRMCHHRDTGGTRLIAKVVPNAVVTDT